MRGCGAGPAVPPLLLLGLLLAAAPGAALAKETAFVEVVLFESSPSGDYTTYTTGLQGRFSRAGATLSAEGEIVQIMQIQDTSIHLAIHINATINVSECIYWNSCKHDAK